MPPGAPVRVMAQPISNGNEMVTGCARTCGQGVRRMTWTLLKKKADDRPGGRDRRATDIRVERVTGR